MSHPSAYPVPEPRKRLPVWLWVVIALFGVLFVCVASIATLGYYVAHRIAENPQGFADRIIASNPNLEVVSRDGEGKMTIRDRSNGKVLTLNFEHGIHIYDGDKEVSIGESGIRVRDGEKNVRVGSASARVPAWIPVYPGSSTKVSVEEEGHGTFVFTTSDSFSQIADYYVKALKDAGFSDVNRAGDVVTARSGNREVTITPESEFAHTKVKVEYRNQ